MKGGGEIAFQASLLLKFMSMKSDQLKSVVDNLLSKLYSFAHSIIPDELQAEQLIIDSYSIFLMKHKKPLEQLELGKRKKDTRLRIHVRNYVYRSMLEVIFELGLKRSSQLNIESTTDQYKSFYSLTPTQRAILHLQEVLEFSPEETCRIVGVTKHEAIEQFYNAQNILRKAIANRQFNEEIHGP